MLEERLYNVLITYDINTKHTEVRNSLIKDYRFEKVIIGSNGIKCNLPNTTLLKNNSNKESVLNTLKKVCKDNNVNLTRAIAVECSNWWALIGEEL